MANKTVYPFGPGGTLPSSIGVINDLTTGGVDKALSAEQGKLIGARLDNLEQDGAGDFGMASRKINLSRYPVNTYSGWYINSSNEWVKGTTGVNNCVLVPLNPGQQYKVYGGTTGTTLALLASGSMVNGGTPDFCTGHTGRTSISADDVYEFTAPEDAAYLYMLVRASSTNKTSYIRTVDIDTEGILPKLVDEITKINSKPIDLSSLSATNGRFINSANEWEANNVHPEYYEIYFIQVTPGDKYVLFGNNTGGVFALLKNKTVSVGNRPNYCTAFPERISLGAGMCLSITAPEDAAYIYVCTKSSNVDTDCYAAIPMHITEQVASAGGSDSVSEDAFENAPERYAWQKAYQIIKLKWTPLKGTIPKSSSTAKFTANEEQTGMLYSSSIEYDKRVFQDVSLHTFMTALHNPYSLLYTENIRYGYSQSAYGRTYYGAPNSGAYYGVVCSGLTSYAENFVPYGSADMPRLAEAGLFEVVYDQSANGVKRGDILQMEGHVMFILDVWRKNGVVTKVRIGEQWEPLARVRGTYSASGFNALLKSEGITIYRNKELYKNIDYEPSPYVAVGDETPQTVTYNDDICTFAGDKPAFIEGDLIYIHCLNLDYPQMEIYKDDVLMETITLASDSRAAKTSDDLAWAVNLSNDGLTYGKYKCRLKNGDTYSDYTYFEIINATVTVDENNVASYASANANAVMWYWQRYHAAVGPRTYNMTPLDGKKTGTIDVSQQLDTHPLFKVVFQGEYGRVAARWLRQ